MKKKSQELSDPNISCPVTYIRLEILILYIKKIFFS